MTQYKKRSPSTKWARKQVERLRRERPELHFCNDPQCLMQGKILWYELVKYTPKEKK